VERLVRTVVDGLIAQLATEPASDGLIARLATEPATPATSLLENLADRL
jgi:hypothetical protein